MKRTQQINIASQSGAALLISIVVMLAMTILAVAATNSNNTQAFMVRNAQFRLETFNASYTEIDSQIDAINARQITDGAPDFLLELVTSGVEGVNVNSAGTGSVPLTLGLQAPTEAGYIDQEIEMTYRQNCQLLGVSLGPPSEQPLVCHEILISSTATLVNKESVTSPQRQVFEYVTLPL